jgi:anti-sigma B factor antagonist
MHIADYTQGPVTVIELVGELDSATAPLSRDRLRDLVGAGSPVLLDLSKMSYMSSAGLRVLLLAYRQANAAGTPLALAGLPHMIRDVMAATGFLDFFTVADTVEDGLRELDL